MDEKIIRVILTWSLLAIQLGFVVYTIYTGSRHSKRLLKWSKERLTLIAKSINENHESFKIAVSERINILARENVALREENEKLREKLKNLGFSDITLDN